MNAGPTATSRDAAQACWLGPGEATTDTVVTVFDRAVDEYPDETFLDISGDLFTYGQVQGEVLRVAGGLRSLGVAKGDVVCVMLDNHKEAVATWLACGVLGAISANINTALKGSFLRHVVDNTGAAIAVVEGDYVDRFAAIADKLPALQDVVARKLPTTTALSSGTALRLLRYEDLQRGDLARSDSADIPPSHPCCIVYTGGTTGPSKGCVLSHEYMLWHARQRLLMSGRNPTEIEWTPLPLFHLNALAGTVLASAVIGGRAAVAPRFSLSGFWPAVEQSGARIVNLLSTMIPLVAQMPDSPSMTRCHGQIRAMIGLPVDEQTKAIWHDRFGVELVGVFSYGQTEAAPISTLLPGEAGKPGSAGKVVPEFDVRIFDSADAELPVGEVGEIVWRPRCPGVTFDGYWRQPEATLATMRNLWYHTGDLGRFDADGWLYFVDRQNDYLRRGGENISSREYEYEYEQHPAIAQVAVHAVFAELAEDDLKVTAVLRPGAELAPRELFDWAVERLPYFALPRYIEFRETLPTSPVGRVLKYQLRTEGCTPQTWDREVEGVEFEKR